MAVTIQLEPPAVQYWGPGLTALASNTRPVNLASNCPLLSTILDVYIRANASAYLEKLKTPSSFRMAYTKRVSYEQMENFETTSYSDSEWSQLWRALDIAIGLFLTNSRTAQVLRFRTWDTQMDLISLGTIHMQ